MCDRICEGLDSELVAAGVLCAQCQLNDDRGPEVEAEPTGSCILCDAPSETPLCAGCWVELEEANKRREPIGLDGEFHPSALRDPRF